MTLNWEAYRELQSCQWACCSMLRLAVSIS